MMRLQLASIARNAHHHPGTPAPMQRQRTNSVEETLPQNIYGDLETSEKICTLSSSDSSSDPTNKGFEVPCRMLSNDVACTDDTCSDEDELYLIELEKDLLKENDPSMHSGEASKPNLRLTAAPGRILLQNVLNNDSQFSSNTDSNTDRTQLNRARKDTEDIKIAMAAFRSMFNDVLGAE